MRKWGLVVVLGLVGVVGCAVGSGPDDLSESDLATTPLDAGDESTSVKLKPPGDDDAGDEGGNPDEGWGIDSGDGTDGSTGGTDAGVDSGSGTISCAASNTCPLATDLGNMSGDTGADFKTVQGTTSQWFQVRVTENDGDIFANSEEMKAVLTSPAGANFDLYLYVPGSDTRECSVVRSSSKNATATDTAGVEFGESGTFSNGDDDSRTITVEVRWVSGTCSAGSKWTLNLYGNQH